MKDPYIEEQTAIRRDNIAAVLGGIIILALFIGPAILTSFGA